jgi:hypothetical protein
MWDYHGDWDGAPLQCSQHVLPVVYGLSCQTWDAEPARSSGNQGILESAEHVLSAMNGERHAAQFTKEALPFATGGMFTCAVCLQQGTKAIDTMGR